MLAPLHLALRQCQLRCWAASFSRTIVVLHRRQLASATPEKKSAKQREIDGLVHSTDSQVEVATFKEKGNTVDFSIPSSSRSFLLAQQAAKDTGYSLIVIAGVAALGGLCYLMLRELYSRETPNGIYKEASKMCLANSEVMSSERHQSSLPLG